jgi:hypothetical protein
MGWVVCAPTAVTESRIIAMTLRSDFINPPT